MKVLFIAPLPPPTHGQSLASDVLYQRLRQGNDVRVVNMAERPARHLWDRLRRVATVLSFMAGVLRKKRGVDVIYLTISESLLGNLKDLCIYVLCLGRLDRMFIHLLGGAGIRRILEGRGLRYRLNRFFISRLAGVIVEGPTQAAIFAGLIDEDKIHVIPNFAEDFLFVTEQEVRQKFDDTRVLRILFLSNLYHGKGHHELVEAYLRLPSDLRQRMSIAFVGGFESSRLREEFLRRIDGQAGLFYRGTFIGGLDKKELYGQTHVFCLPTYYPYEGQPISILEAYATGCAVITTAHSGIPDVFRDGVNGYVVQAQSSEAIRQVLEKIARDPRPLVTMALTNRDMASERFRTETYQSSLTRILERRVG
ncbi:MAG TPA: glycosyltransferase family 4 protein [Vicinamibacterales bacterium]|nr:glycosyltransferase family 4 protein [Vicinamibacterales bacterium]